MCTLLNEHLRPVCLQRDTCFKLLIAAMQVNCLTAFFYDEAISRAIELDETFKRSGKPVGPLHGLPIAIKVRDIEILSG